MEHIEHPEIQWYMRTGYPSYAQPDLFDDSFDDSFDDRIYCEKCGDEITNDFQYEDEDYEYLCKDCLLDRHLKE
jgi:formylmethanofuran dehydrogenase subunit E